MSDNPLETAPAAAAVRRTKRSKKKSKPNGAASTTSPADPNSRTISITLTNDVLAWYERQAAIAPFEPSVQKYIAWQLKGWAKAGHVAAPSAAAPAVRTPEETIASAHDE